MSKSKLAKKSPFKVGRVERKPKGGGFLKVEPDSFIKFVPLVGLDQLVSADMHEYWEVRPAIFHPCLGEGCPGCLVGNQPRFKAYLPVQLPDGETAIFPFTMSVYNALEELEDALERSIKGLVIKVSRKGSGMNTSYSVINMNKEVAEEDLAEFDQDEVVAALGSFDRDEIVAKLEAAGIEVRKGGYEGVELSEDEDDKWS